MDVGARSRTNSHERATSHDRPSVLLMVVGVWRTERCGHASLVENLGEANPQFHSRRPIVCTDPSTLLCKAQITAAVKFRKHDNLTANILGLYPSALIEYAEISNHPGAAANKAWSNLFAHRASLCYENAINRLGGSSAFAAALVIRPDVFFMRPMHLPPLSHSALYIVLGFYQRACIFADRDFDFGWLAVPPTTLPTWLNSMWSSSADASFDPLQAQPAMPEGFNGYWLRATRASRRLAGEHPFVLSHCGANTTVTRNKTRPYERAIRALDAAGTPLTAFKGSALSLSNPKMCDMIYNSTAVEGGAGDTSHVGAPAALSGLAVMHLGAALAKHVYTNRTFSPPEYGWGEAAFKRCCSQHHLRAGFCI